jgi:hypothetical protein
MTAYPKFVDLCGWLTFWLAIILGIVAIAGIISVLYAASPSGLARAEQKLHLVHHVIQPNWTGVIPFVLCLLLACGVAFLGYSVTKRSVEHRISMVEPGSPANGSQEDR